MNIRLINTNELNNLLTLYEQLHNNSFPCIDEELLYLWETIIADKNYYIVVAVEDKKIISSCVMIIIPNLTHNQRPYALIENVVTDMEYRNKGFATKCLHYAKRIAVQNNCYKIMLMTGSKKDSTLNFYKKAGYNDKDKTAFIQWL